MIEYIDSIVKTDDVVLLLSCTPQPLLPYLLAAQQFNEIPIPKENIDGIIGLIRSSEISVSFLESIDSIINDETIIKELSKIDNVGALIQQLQRNSASEYTSLFNPLLELEPIAEHQLVVQFDSASNLVSAFDQNSFIDTEFNLLPMCDKESQRILQSALACQMIGLKQSAKILIERFIESQLIHSNESYQSLQSVVIKRIGVKESASKSGASGRNRRHAARDLVKKYTTELYLQKEYKNPHQAAQLIIDKVVSYAKTVNYSFTSNYQATKTIHAWLTEYKRSQQ